MSAPVIILSKGSRKRTRMVSDDIILNIMISSFRKALEDARSKEGYR